MENNSQYEEEEDELVDIEKQHQHRQRQKQQYEENVHYGVHLDVINTTIGWSIAIFGIILFIMIILIIVFYFDSRSGGVPIEMMYVAITCGLMLLSLLVMCCGFSKNRTGCRFCISNSVTNVKRAITSVHCRWFTCFFVLVIKLCVMSLVAAYYILNQYF